MRGKRDSKIKELKKSAKPVFYKRFGFPVRAGLLFMCGLWGIFRLADLKTMVSAFRPEDWGTLGRALLRVDIATLWQIVSGANWWTSGAMWALGRGSLTTILMFIIVFMLWDQLETVVSQFVLPVHSPEERHKARKYFADYAGRGTSRVFWVQNGQIKAHTGETTEPTPGVMLVDSVSAVALQTDLKFTRAMGPGVTFLEANEYPAGDFGSEALDLRPQYRELADEEAITRDGVVVTANIGVTFKLDSGEGQQLRDWSLATTPPYAFAPGSASRAFYARPYAGTGQSRWDELPGALALEVWREVVARADFGALFGPETSDSNQLHQLQAEVADRLQFKRSQQSREQRMLTECGLAVLTVEIFKVRLPPDVTGKLIDNWKRDHDQQRQMWRQQRAHESENKAKPEAAHKLLELLTRRLRTQIPPGSAITLPSENVLDSLTDETRRLAEEYSAQVPAQQRHIEELDMWAKRLLAEATPRPKG